MMLLGLFVALQVAYTVVPQESDDINASIDRAVEHMNFIARPIARHRLRVNNPLPAHLELDVRTDSIVILRGDEPRAALPRDETAVPWRSLGGDKCQVSATLVGDTLTERIVAHGGESEARYVFLDGGHRIRQEVRITSSHLPQPVVYAVTFVKAP